MGMLRAERGHRRRARRRLPLRTDVWVQNKPPPHQPPSAMLAGMHACMLLAPHRVSARVAPYHAPAFPVCETRIRTVDRARPSRRCCTAKLGTGGTGLTDDGRCGESESGEGERHTAT